MVWYIPPLSPVVDALQDTRHDAEDHGNLFAAIEALRIPVEYLAELFTAGDIEPVNDVLRKLAAMRSYMRDINLGREPRPEIAAKVGMTEEEIYNMYRLLAFGESSGHPTPVAVENFRMLQDRQTADSPASVAGQGRVNLLNWDGRGTPDGLMPDRDGGRHRR